MIPADVDLDHCVDDDEPEHRGDRRRFLIWALMLGATSPQVVVERIVAEVERETTS